MSERVRILFILRFSVKLLFNIVRKIQLKLALTNNENGTGEETAVDL